MKPWYETLFSNYAQKYDAECFVQGTLEECTFIEEELKYQKELKILDLGCGTGRHAIELSKRGYLVTGVDLSEAQLKRAREKAKAADLCIDFQKHDARELPFIEEFDAAIMICEGAFPLMETDEMNFEILKNIKKALKKSSTLIFTTLNALFALYNNVEKFCAAQGSESNAKYQENFFNLMNFRDYNTISFEDDDGKKSEIKCNERYYAPCEIQWLLKSLGFQKIEIFGAKPGSFSRKNALTKDDFEMLVIAKT